MSQIDPKQYAAKLLNSIKTKGDMFSMPIPVGRLRVLCNAVLGQQQEEAPPPLTDTERAVLTAIKADVAQGIQPTVRSVQKRLSYASPNSARQPIDRLLKLGYIKRDGSRKQIILAR
jgi:hypothetical protein|nr:MAG TPA: LexA DNA binding domain [Caudoviricetes sp.]